MKKEKTLMCEFCGKYVANDLKGLATHRRYNKECENKWVRKKDEEKSKLTFVTCEICGDKLRNISNTHLKKHNITQQEYIVMFSNSPIFADGLLETQKERREKTILERYSKEEIYEYLSSGVTYCLDKSIYNAFANKTEIEKQEIIKRQIVSNIKTKKNMIEDGTYDDMVKRRTEKLKITYQKMKDDGIWDIFLERSIEKRKTTNLLINGIEYPQKLQKTKDKQKQTLIKNFGSLENAYSHINKKSMESRKAKYGSYYYYCPMFSFESQNLFNDLELHMSGYTTYYATKKNTKYQQTGEFQVKVNSKKCSIRYLDYYVEELNKYIEFDEEHHKYQITEDLERSNEIFESIGSNCIRIYKKDYLENKEKTIIKCLDFLMA